MDVIYLDNNATTRPDPRVVQALVPYLTELYGNASSVHRFGQRARQAIDHARAQVAELVGCDPAELVFTGGGTESCNTAIRGLLASRTPRNRIIISAVEHSAVRELGHELSRQGVEVVEIAVDGRGFPDLDQLAQAINDQTALVSMMWANNETGVIMPVEQVATICRRHRVPFYCDATQAVGKIPVNLQAMGIDCAGFAAHKFHGPKGVGALFIRRGLRLRPWLIGGPQERGRRGGTENVPGIVGMGQAAALAQEALSEMGYVANLRDRLEQAILANIPDTYVNGDRSSRLPNTTNIGFARLQAEAILLLLSEQGICASAGAACSSGSLEPSHVLRAMRIDESVAHGAVRFSLSRFTTESEIQQTVSILPQLIERLRSVLPVA